MLDVDQETLEKLLAENPEFKKMHQRHAELNEKVDRASHGELGLCDDTVTDLKKEKLVLRDRMMEIVSMSEYESDPYVRGIRDGYAEAITALEAHEYHILEPGSERLWNESQSINGEQRRYLSGKSESMMRAALWLGIS